jgi:hypothetical protein
VSSTPDAATFLRALFAPATTGWAGLWLKDPDSGRSSTRWRPVREAGELAAGLPTTRDVYVACSTRRARPPGSQRGDAASCAAITALWVDVDVAGPGHAAVDLPPDLEAAGAWIDRFPLEASALVITGGGIHAWYFLDVELEAVAAVPVLEGWRAAWEEHAAVEGWRVDPVWDLPRVMRLPGTWNRKATPARAVELRALEPDRRYGLEAVVRVAPGRPPAITTHPAGFRRSQGNVAGATARGRAALDAETRSVAATAAGGRNNALNAAAYNLGQLVAAGELDEGDVEASLLAAAAAAGLGDVEAARTIRSGLEAGKRDPRSPPRVSSNGGAGTSTPPSPPSSMGDAEGGGGPTRRVIITNHRELAPLVDETLEAIRDWQAGAPRLFIRGGVVVRVVEDEQGRTSIRDVDAHSLRLTASRAAKYVRAMREGDRATFCPLDVLTSIVRSSDLPFPALAGVTGTPIVRLDGTIVTTPGYDASTARWLSNHCTIPPPVAGDDALTAALSLVLELVEDFPFAANVDFANAFALLLTPLVRDLVACVPPLCLIDSPTPGTGKGLLAKVVGVLATGQAPAMMAVPPSHEEFTKLLATVLFEGEPVTVWDNVDRPLRSDALAAALTTDPFRGRVLGRSETLSIPNRTTMIATGNNLRVGGDLARRSYRIRLDARTAYPDRRRGFKHDELVAWVAGERGRILSALATIVAAWIVAGRPLDDAAPAMGEATPWVRIVGGILRAANVTGFLSNADEVRESVDVEAAEWAAFLGAWVDLELAPCTSAELARTIDQTPAFAEHMPSELAHWRSAPDFPQRLGGMLNARSGRAYGADRLAITRTGWTRLKVAQWAVAPVVD